MIFRYNGIDKESGKKAKGIIEAADMEDAKKRLRAKGVLYTGVEESQKSVFENFAFSRRGKITPSELSVLSRDLSIYLKAGISIVSALKLAKNQYRKNKKISNFFNSIITLLDEGKSFYQSLEAQKILAIPEFYKQSIKVSENSGILQEVLLELSIFLKEQDRINKQISSAFAYPAFIIIVSIFMVAFMITFVVPKITSMFDQLGQELPPITKFVIGTSDFLSANWVWILLVLVGVTGTYLAALRFSSSFRYGIHRFLLGLPFFGGVIESSELGRFAYMASMLTRSGVPFVQTINLSANLLKNDVLRKVFNDSAKKVVEGSKFSSALMKADYEVDTSFIQAVALGEETSQVSVILNNLSELYFEENKDKIDVLLSLLEPILMLLVGGIIGFIVTAMLLPIFSMNIGQ